MGSDRKVGHKMKNALLKLSQIYDLTPEAVKGLKEHYGYFKLLKEFNDELISKINLSKEKPLLHYHDYQRQDYGGYYFHVFLNKDDAENLFKLDNIFIMAQRKFSHIQAYPKIEE